MSAARDRRQLCGALAGAGAAVVLALPRVARAQPAPPPGPKLGEIKPLGGDRFQVGRIVVDKAAARFSVPGKVLVLGKPLEYLATAPRGLKAYEALLEVDTTGSEFNLACILVGLERSADAVPARGYRRTRRLVGPLLAMNIAWQDGAQRRQVSAAEAILNAGAGVQPDSVQWVYTGAPASDGRPGFAPDHTGTLIGFVHDANTIVESVEPIGLGAYGSVRGNAELLPPVGTAVELLVEVVRPAATGR